MDSQESSSQKLPPNITGRCSHCQNETSTRCQGCIEGIDENEASVDTWYCNSKCQKADWNAHKVVCKPRRARKQLYRAGETVQAAFFAYREVCYDVPLLKAENRGNLIYVFEGLNQFAITAFPSELMLDPTVKQAVLANTACKDAAGCFHGLIKKSLEGLCKGIKEITVRIHRPLRQIIRFSQDNGRDITFYRHEILQVTLKDDSVYAFDTTGAQYGFPEPIIRWDQYVATRMAEIVETHDFGHWRGDFDEQMRSLREQVLATGQRRIKFWKWMVHYQPIKAFDAALDDWLKEKNTTISRLQNLPVQLYLQQRSSLISRSLKAAQDAVTKRERVAKKKRREHGYRTNGSVVCSFMDELLPETRAIAAVSHKSHIDALHDS